MPFTLTDKQWTEEVSRALAAAGVAWQVGSCWCKGTTCMAELVHRGSGKSRVVSVSGETFTTALERRVELVRLLQG